MPDVVPAKLFGKVDVGWVQNNFGEDSNDNADKYVDFGASISGSGKFGIHR